MQHQQQLWHVASSSLCRKTLLRPKEPEAHPHGAGCHFQAGRRGTPARPLTHPRALVRRRPEGPVPSRPGLPPPDGVRTSRGRPRAAETHPAPSSGVPFPAPGPPHCHHGPPSTPGPLAAHLRQAGPGPAEQAPPAEQLLQRGPGQPPAAAAAPRQQQVPVRHGRPDPPSPPARAA